jgi:hypothetical protein
MILYYLRTRRFVFACYDGYDRFENRMRPIEEEDAPDSMIGADEFIGSDGRFENILCDYRNMYPNERVTLF